MQKRVFSNKFIKIVFFLLILLNFSSNSFTQDNQDRSVSESRIKRFAKKSLEIIKDKAYLMVPLACLALCSSEQTKNIILNQLRPENLVKNFATNYLLTTFESTTHELGHALTAKALNNDPINIELGTKLEKSQEPLFKSKNLQINNLNLESARARFRIPRDPKTFVTNKNKLAACYLGGGFFSLFCHYIKHLGSKLVTDKQTNFFLDKHVMNQIFNVSVPIGTEGDSDAALLWKNCLNIPGKIVKSETLDASRTILSLLYHVLIAYKTRANPDANILEIMSIALLNHELDYLNFHA